MSHDPLDELLQSWREKGRLPARFQREVWERLALRSREAVPPVRPHRGAWTMLIVASAVAFLLATGQARRWEEKRWTELKAQYFQTVDPQALAAAQRTP
ncbi:hypothetical protein [Methylacidimicrobium cyclopophantes]|nr:hypothetical protein [Methylacidimicrobium cyclopophantes]